MPNAPATCPTPLPQLYGALIGQPQRIARGQVDITVVVKVLDSGLVINNVRKISPPSREACEVLGRWDRSNRVDARGAHLFREWWRITKDVPGLWRLPFNAEDAVRHGEVP